VNAALQRGNIWNVRDGRPFSPRHNRRMVMTKFKAIGAVALAIALAAASPAMARGGGGGGGHGGGGHMGGGGGHFGGGAHFAGGGGFHGGGFRRGGGWGPGLAVGALAGAAALGYYGAYGPGYDSYAYDNGAYDNGYGYYDNSGYSCQPGTYFRGQDGRRYLCQ
jgi:hypothetical protein